MGMSSATAIFLISLLAIPLTYVVNSAQNFSGEWGLFMAGIGALTLVISMTYYFVVRNSRDQDSFYYVLTVCTFGGVASLIIALEGDGIITGFMTNYLRHGEPYLKTAHGILVSYWDGIGHYSMCLMMLSAMSWNQSYREVGLYWAGSIGHSMIVFIPGNVVGKYGLRWSFLLNVPYMIIPFTAAARFLRERPPTRMAGIMGSLRKRPADVIFIFGLLVSATIALLRGFAVLGCHHEFFTDYIKRIEPYLEDPVAYPKIQMLVYLFYYVPYYTMAIYALLYGSNGGWMADWALLHAGAAAQAQVTHIGASLHYRTPYVMRVPGGSPKLVFWAVNAFLLVFPQLLAYRLAPNSPPAKPKRS